MKYLTLFLIACIFSLTFAEKQWKRVADLPDYDEKDLLGMGHMNQEQADPMKELEDIFSKLNPNGNQELSTDQYKNLLKDLILGAGRADIENQGKDSIAAIQHKLIGSIIDEYVDLEMKGSNTMQDLLQDLEQEKLLQYIDKVYKRKLDSMDL